MDRRQQQIQEPPRLSPGVRFKTPQSMPISSIMAGSHQANRVAVPMKAPCMLVPPQPRSQTSIQILSTTLL
jgi:hypothetical protein